MNKFLVYVALSLAAGIALGAWLTRDRTAPSAPAPVAAPAAAPASFDAGADVRERLAALERAVSAEREARRIVEDELLALYAQLESLQREAPGTGAATADASQPVDADRDGPAPDPAVVEAASRQSREQSLVDAGFSPARAASILERESALQFERMQAIYEARNSDNPRERFESITSPEQALRAELGDADYERYLRATGQPTAVDVLRTMASSPASAAGLRPGDEIVAYDGERVFSMTDLTSRVMRAGDGETVTIDIRRDGVPMQVTVPRGPIGIEIAPRRGPGP